MRSLLSRRHLRIWNGPTFVLASVGLLNVKDGCFNQRRSGLRNFRLFAWMDRYEFVARNLGLSADTDSRGIRRAKPTNMDGQDEEDKDKRPGRVTRGQFYYMVVGGRQPIEKG